MNHAESDLADELFRAPGSAPPTGVRVATARRGGVTVTRVKIARRAGAPPGRYVTLEVPRVSLLDERDEAVIEPAAAELQALLPPAGPVLVLGVGNRRVTSDALGPRTVQKIFVTMGSMPSGAGHPAGGGSGTGRVGSTGLSLQQLAGALVPGKSAPLPCSAWTASALPNRSGWASPAILGHRAVPAQPGHSRPCGCLAGGAGRSGGHPTLTRGRGGQRPCSDPFASWTASSPTGPPCWPRP